MQIRDGSATFGAALAGGADVIAATDAEPKLGACAAEPGAVDCPCKSKGIDRQKDDQRRVGEGDRFEMTVQVRIGGIQTPELEPDEGVGFAFGGFVEGINGAVVG